MRRKTRKNRWILWLLAAALIPCFSAAAGVFFYQSYLSADSVSSLQIEDAPDGIVEEVAQIMILPSEQPVIGTVLDKSRLSDEPFFAQAENGDRVLIFSQARKAVLYRPDTGQIVESETLTDTSSVPSLPESSPVTP